MPKRKCKNGLLKTPVKTAKGMRYCKKSVRKSKRKVGKKKSKRKKSKRKPCKSNQVRNRSTGRCRNKPVRKKFVRKSKRKVSKKKSKKRKVSKKKSKSYRWLSYSASNKYTKEAKRLGVSKVARSRSGFMGVYKRKRTSKIMNNYAASKTLTWGEKRNAFIKRHMVQYVKKPTYRRWLAFAMWAYKPQGSKPLPK